MISDKDGNLENSISILFANDTKVSVKITIYENTGLLQQDLNNIYCWAHENLMKFNEINFK